MKHRQHMILGGIAIVVAFMLLARGGASPLAAGFGFALLLCPIVMGTVMWLLMRQPKNSSSPDGHHEINVAHDHKATSGRP
ncbi:MAG: hypothetical protein ABI862_15390 [Ilumatobacteraceae bacterium]